ncbi:hypothetical protein FO519_007111 [Halicephalobus sp. NKZ332]|nr:hypothetical protein FO519_007111 [Halicephalobus sp. NKZ332]
MVANIPQSLHDVAKYMALSQTFAQRDTVVYYWTVYHVVQEGMKIDKTSKEALGFLTGLLTELEALKKSNPDNEAMRNDIVAQAHLESVALKLFRYADENDRAGNFDPKVRKAFYNSSLLLDVLAGFKEGMDDSLINMRKYAKWKAAYLFNCEKTGETPVPGGFNQDKQESDPAPQPPKQRGGLDPPPPPPTVADLGFGPSGGQISSGYSSDPTMYQSNQPGQFPGYPQQPNYGYQQHQAPQPTPPPRPSVQPPSYSHTQIPTNANTASGLKLEDFIEARKYCKYALSALDYEDASTAMENMLKSIQILQGQSP